MTDDLPTGYKMTELGPLPEDWRVVRLGEVVEKTKQIDPRKKPEWFFKYVDVSSVDNELLRITSYQNFAGKEAPSRARKQIDAGDVLFATVRPYLKRIAIVPPELDGHICSTAFCVLRAKNEIDACYLFFAVAHEPFVQRVAEHQRGSSYPAVTDQDVLREIIPLPPLDEQRAIAHVLRTVQEAKEATERVIAALRELKKSLMRHLFTRGPVPLDAAGNVELRETEIGPIPAHWRVVRLGEIARVKYGKAKPINEHGNIPVIGSGGIYGWTAEAAVDFATLIIGRKGTAGQVWLSETPSWPSDTTFYLEWKSHTTVDVRFIYGWFLLNPLSGEHAKTTIPSLQRPDLENSLVPLPPLDEQREIARMLQAVDAKIAAEQARRAALEELFKSLLHELMSGRIRVPNIIGGQRSRDSAPDADPLPESED